MSAAAGGATPSGRPAVLVAAGILLSRLLGLVRQRVFGHYFGVSDAADAFNAAFKIPNFLQNLFGEGVLSASFIPVYARLLAESGRENATRVAGGVAGLLGLVVSILVLLGVWAAPVLIEVIAPGFGGPKRQLTVHLVQILFPGAGLLALSAWCLGVLNSHRRFLLSYTAPVIWNIAIIVALVAAGKQSGRVSLAVTAAWGSVVGSLLQVLVQLPMVLRLLGPLRLSLDMASSHVRTVVANFGPVFVGRGVVQISAYVDTVLASLLPSGAVAALAYAQVLYTLPVSLFGMSVSAAELPAMSSVTGSEEERGAYLRDRLNAGLRRIAFFVVPSAVAFVALGDVVTGAVYQSGEFTHEVTVYVWGILAGAAVGLLASTLGRLYASTYYALHDTRTPLRFALVRVTLTVGLGYLFALPLPRLLGIPPRWGAAGLTLSAGMAAWVELRLLRRALRRRIGATGINGGFLARLAGAALAAAGIGWGVKTAIGVQHPIVAAIFILGAFGLGYVAIAFALGISQARSILMRASRGGRGG